MRSCMTLSNREHIAAYELLIYVATVLEELYRVVERELPKSSVYRTKGSQKDVREGKSCSEVISG